MLGATLSAWTVSSLLLSLRLAPVFALAPPFTLVRVPPMFRMFFGIGLAASLVAANPVTAMITDLSLGHVLAAAAREMMLGMLFVLVFQLVFASLYLAGRTVDFQAGFGLALLIDPTTRSQTPLVGTLFAYVAAMLFFAMNGHLELLRIFVLSLEAVPLGAWTMPQSLGPLSLFIGTIFMFGLSMGGAAIITLFLIDVAIAVLSRTVPQMNALIIGIQVKTLVLLAVLPLCFGIGAAVLVRMMRLALQSLPELIA